MSKYDDIINLDRPVSRVHKPMSREMRAAQFAPFSALTGYNEAIRESARITDKKIEISDGIKEIINEKLKYIADHIKEIGEIKVTYFIKDALKSGGSYTDIVCKIKKIDINNRFIFTSDGKKILFDDILDISGDAFNYFEM